MSNDRPSPTGTVLVVDDDDATRRLVVKWLEGAGLACLQANNGVTALALLRQRATDLDLVVLDVMMPTMGGFDVLKNMRADPELTPIPVILLTAHAEDEADVVRGAALGAIDHLTKPFSGPILKAKVMRAVERRQSERKLAIKLEEAEKLARIDPLTQLGNRQLLRERLREESAYARRHHQPCCVALLDIDHFKQINDTLGHDAGDQALKHFSKLLAAALRQEDGAFRYGGEEFVLLLRNADAKVGLTTTDRLRTALRLRPVKLSDGNERFITFSAGVAVANDENEFLTENLLSRADEALYRAKESGRNRDEVASSEPRPPGS
jgi:two-component system cell cycle response regulator